MNSRVHLRRETIGEGGGALSSFISTSSNRVGRLFQLVRTEDKVSGNIFVTLPLPERSDSQISSSERPF